MQLSNRRYQAVRPADFFLSLHFSGEAKQRRFYVLPWKNHLRKVQHGEYLLRTLLRPAGRPAALVAALPVLHRLNLLCPVCICRTYIACSWLEEGYKNKWRPERERARSLNLTPRSSNV